MARAKRGSIQRLGRGRYRVWYYDNAGDRRSEVVHGDERAALACLASHQDAPTETPPVGASHGVTVGAFYDDVYHPALIRRRLAPRTVEGYESQWKLIRDTVGAWPLDGVTARQVEAFVQSLPTAGQQNAAHKILRQLFNYAYRLEYIEHNPMTRHIERSLRMPFYRRDTYTAEEARAVLEAARDFEFAPIIYLCMLGGLRRSEALGLLWSDLERVDGGVMVHVSRTWQRKRGTQGAESPTKTGRSVRKVLIPKPYSEALDPTNHDPAHGVVAEPRPNPDRVTRAWCKYCHDMSIHYVSLQGLRATYSTLLAGAGVSDALVSDSLGHSVLQTRYKHYLNADDASRHKVAEALRNAIK